MPPSLGAGRALGPDHVLAVRAGDHPDWTAVLDIEERGVADVPPVGVELVEYVGDLVALVILQGGPPRAYAPQFSGISGIWASTLNKYSFFHPARRRRRWMLLPLLSSSALRRHNANLRSHAKFAALLPAQCR